MEQDLIGLDVGKAWLDGHLARSGRRLRVGNDARGVADLVAALGTGSGCLVVMEASGGYERTAHRELAARGVPAAIVNPSNAARSIRLRSSRREGAGGRVRDFARGMGLEAKTDRLDAKLIARYGAVMRPAAPPRCPSPPGRRELREILAARRQLLAEIAAARRQQLERLQSPAVRACLEKALAFLQQEAKKLLRLLRERIAADRPHPRR
jgi:transposase